MKPSLLLPLTLLLLLPLTTPAQGSGETTARLLAAAAAPLAEAGLAAADLDLRQLHANPPPPCAEPPQASWPAGARRSLALSCLEGGQPRWTIYLPLRQSAPAAAPPGAAPLPLIRRGEAVALRARAQGLEVRASGKALMEAPLGGTIRVENLLTRRTLQGRVSGPGMVDVDF